MELGSRYGAASEIWEAIDNLESALMKFRRDNPEYSGQTLGFMNHRRGHRIDIRHTPSAARHVVEWEESASSLSSTSTPPGGSL